MPYLAQYKHDVFVSYAHSGLLTPWSNALRQSLTKYLNEFLELKGAQSVDVWMDYQLEGNVGLTAQLKERVEGSALLLIIMSKFYLQSPWCQNEAVWFADTCQARVVESGRVFVVRCRPTDSRSWPPFLKEENGSALTGYRFYPEEGADGSALPFGHPIPEDAVDDSRQDFYRAVTTLADQMQRQLRRLANTTAEPITPRPRRSRLRPVESATKQVSPTNVFLAVATEEVASEQEALRAALTAAGLNVLPDAAESQPSAAASLFKEAAPSCAAGAMVLPRLPGRDFAIEGRPLAAWQHEQLQRLGLPVVAWLPPSIDLLSIRDQQHRAFVESLRPLRAEDPATVAAAVKDVMPGTGGAKRFVYLDTPLTIETEKTPSSTSDSMERDLRAMLQSLNARVFPIGRRRLASNDLSALDEYRRQLRDVKARCDGLLLLLSNPDVLPDLWLLDIERDVAPAAERLGGEHHPPQCAVIDATGTYEHGDIDGLSVFRYPSAGLQSELARWLK
jgi:hypothetical protein